MAEAVACLSCHKHVGTRRGLCRSCYGMACRRIQRGETTWEQLEREGQCLPAKRHPWRKRQEE